MYKLPPSKLETCKQVNWRIKISFGYPGGSGKVLRLLN